MAVAGQLIHAEHCATHNRTCLPERIDDLTCCRALFAAWVFAYHVNLQLGRPDWPLGLGALLDRGYLGVDGFFILSGLVLALAHPELGLHRAGLADFWRRRLARLYPVHLAMILLLAALLGLGLLAGVTPREPERFALAELLRSLLLVQAWGFSDRLAWNYPSWSISTEWAGYLAFPLLWLLIRRLPPALLALLPPAALAALLVVGAGPGRLNLTYGGALARFFPEFLAGMAITALLARSGRAWAARPVRFPRAVSAIAGRRGSLAAMGLLVAIAGLALPDGVVVAGLWLVLAGLSLAAGQGSGVTLARWRVLRGLGVMSYAFYMSFAPVEMIQAFLWRRLATAPADRPVLYVLLTTAMTLALGFAAWRWVERPARRWLMATPG